MPKIWEIQLSRTLFIVLLGIKTRIILHSDTEKGEYKRVMIEWKKVKDKFYIYLFKRRSIWNNFLKHQSEKNEKSWYI